ncbi:hypothetical protein [Paenibacillus alvei]|uniref:hypothetical protein n=1 Tax=Paenibacillus alvei TaxID=44250 RepID=UPI00227F4DFB|nr:hypothetical protein [Paenibacillus alvei]
MKSLKNNNTLFMELDEEQLLLINGGGNYPKEITGGSAGIAWGIANAGEPTTGSYQTTWSYRK